MKLTEAQVTQQIKGWMLAKGWTAYRLQSGTVKSPDGERYITLNPAGTPDWLFVRRGEILFVEMKATGKDLSAKQFDWFVRARVDGTPAVFADSLDEFLSEFKRFYAD